MGTRTWILGFLLIFVHDSKASWGTPGLGQYHIQTDEGPERYFRYQTDNGQYRKEKRLQDGTVIGTDAWIDASGFLRQKDYIADSRGYRILKSKTIYVGKGRPIEEALKTAKTLPAHAGTLVKQVSPSSLNDIRSSDRYTSTAPTTSTGINPILYAASITPSPYLGYDHYPTPNVLVRPHSQPIDSDYYQTYGPPATSRSYASPSYYPDTTAKPDSIPSRYFEPPVGNSIEPIAVYTPTTISPISSDYRSPIAAYPSSTPQTPISSTTPTSAVYPSSTAQPLPYSSTIKPDIYSTNIDHRSFAPISSTTAAPPIESTTSRGVIPITNNNLGVQPLYTRPSLSPQTPRYNEYYSPRPLQYNNNLGNGYDPQYPLYDGVSITDNGFRYYLPRHYHEEENLGGQARAGSFGYIDPFGIRRVIYYNASPGRGFVHRKNNRYVGFDATPYDPRPL